MLRQADPAAAVICPYCLSTLDGATTTCPWCAAGHHRDCWDENVGCAVAGCGGAQGGAPVAATPSPELDWSSVKSCARACAGAVDLSELRSVLITQLGVLSPGKISGYESSGRLPPSLVEFPSAIRAELMLAVDAAFTNLDADKTTGRHTDESRRLLLLAGEEGYRLGRYLLGTHTTAYAQETFPGPGASLLEERLTAWEAFDSSIAEHLGPEVMSAVESLACEVGAFESRALSWSGRRTKRIGHYGALVQSGIEIAVAEFESQAASTAGR